MAEITDELLMAYADGALDPATCATVEAALEQCPQYREKVEKFRATRDPIHVAFREQLEARHLAPLIDRIRSNEFDPAVTAAKPNSEGVIRIFGETIQARGYGYRRHLPAAMAASVALLVGAALGWSLNSRPVVTSQLSRGFVTFSDGSLLAQGALRELLEGARSDAPVAAKTVDGKAWKLSASFTFRSTKQSPCRRYEISGSAGRFAGYACRSGEGQWLVRAHANLATKVPNSKAFAPAGGDEDAALEAAIRAAMDGDVYQSGEEAELIARGWNAVGK